MIYGDPTLVAIDWGPQGVGSVVPFIAFHGILLTATARRRIYAMGTALEPLTYAVTLGTTSQQILPANPTRKGIIFFNPANANAAICPSLSNTSQPVAAAIGGAGSITIGAGSIITMPPVAWVDAMATCAWNAIGTNPGQAFTAWEF